uniref:Movement protein n=2 Tax=Emaravirus cajani TaxID=1980429 RepID=A0A219T3W1_9VIRU|nr:movement protein [Emaravirus cajani]ANQ90754.1 movement protein [Emaravirus cajani]
MHVFLFLIILTKMAGTSGDVRQKQTETLLHNYANGDISADRIDEIVWKNILSAQVKTSLKVGTKPALLPISIYNTFYRRYMSVKQRQTRLSSISFFWTPTSKSFSGNAVLYIVDGRNPTEGKKRWDKNAEVNSQISVDFQGSILTVVTFDPNFQQFITGSLDIATATIDIHKIEFYIHVCHETMSKEYVAGFLDMSWKTVPDEAGVYEKVKFDVFTLPLTLPPEIKMQQGKTSFEKMKNYLKGKYDRQMRNLKQIEDITNEIAYGNDGGLTKEQKDHSETINTIGELLNSSSLRIRALDLKSKNDEVNAKIRKLKDVMANGSIDEIRDATDDLKSTCIKYGIDIPDDIKSQDGYAKIGEAT